LTFSFWFRRGVGETVSHRVVLGICIEGLFSLSDRKIVCVCLGNLDCRGWEGSGVNESRWAESGVAGSETKDRVGGTRVCLATGRSDVYVVSYRCS